VQVRREVGCEEKEIDSVKAERLNFRRRKSPENETPWDTIHCITIQNRSIRLSSINVDLSGI
jgi:hypothetical protein